MQILYVLLLVCITLSSFAQSDSLSPRPCELVLRGSVLDGETKEPLQGASVFLTEKNTGILSGEKGGFSFPGLCSGIYHLEITYFGYKSYSKEITVTGNVYKTVILHSDTCLLESVEIVAKPYEQQELQQSIELSGKELDNTRGLSLGEALKVIPGVSSLQTGPSIFKPVIQGMYGNRVLILNNGVRQEGQQWGSEHAPELDPFVASRITVIKGASGVRYGQDAIAGVVLVDPEELRTEPGLGGELNLGAFSNNRQGVASGKLDWNWKKAGGLKFRLQGTVKKAGNSRTPDYYMKNTGFEEFNFSWAAGYKIKAFDVELFYSQFNAMVGIFSAAHIGNLTDLKQAIESPVPLESADFTYTIDRPYQDISHELFKVRTNYDIKAVGKLELVFARQYNYRAEYDKHSGSGNGQEDDAERAFKITTHTLNFVLVHNTIGSVKGEAGISLMRQGNTTSGTANSFLPNFLSYTGGIFWIERWRHEKLEIEAGVRYDYKWMKTYMYEDDILTSPEFTFSNFSGTAGALIHLNKTITLRTDLSTAFRPAAVNELFSNGLHHGSARLEYGDQSLRSEYAYHHSVTLSFQARKAYGEVQVYNHFINDYIYLVPSMIYDQNEGKYVPEFKRLIQGAYPVFRYRQTNALFSGIDFSMNDSLSRNFILNAKFSLLRAYDTKAKQRLVLTPPANLEYGLKYVFNLRNSITDTYLKLSHLLVSRKDKVPEEMDFLPPPKAYMLFHLESGFRINAGKQPLDITFTVYNILNEKYRDYMDRFRYYTDAVGRNFVLRLKVPIN